MSGLVVPINKQASSAEGLPTAERPSPTAFAMAAAVEQQHAEEAEKPEAPADE